MNRTFNAASVLVTLLVLALLGFAGYWIYRGSILLVEALLPSVGAGVLFACGTALVCAAIVSRGLSRSRRSEGATEARKGELYERVLRDLGQAPDPRLERDLVLYANKAVLQSYLELRWCDDPGDPLHAHTWHRLVVEIRKDLGHRDGVSVVDAGVLDLLSEIGGGEPEAPEESEPAPRDGEFRVMSP